MPDKTISLSWPPSELSGHNTGHWRKKASVVKAHRQEAHLCASLARWKALRDKGDIHFKVTFYPPDRRSDRINYPNRMKPYFDGIAGSMGVNDNRFAIPEYVVCEPSEKPRVIVELLP